MSKLDGLGGRLSELIASEGVSQTEFADRVGTSQGFISDVTRDIKKPGAEFLYAVREQHGASLDWLVAGDGSMYGGSAIDLGIFKIVVSLVALARAAMVDAVPEALGLVEDILKSASVDDLSTRLQKQLQSYSSVGEESMLAAVLYNSHLWTAKPEDRIRNSLNGAVAYFQSKRPLDILRALGQGTTSSPSGSSGRSQVNIGKSVRAAGRDYREQSKRPRKT